MLIYALLFACTANKEDTGTSSQNVTSADVPSTAFQLTPRRTPHTNPCGCYFRWL